jgi:ribosomal-protein-alanine N-acetyltransferase
MSLPEDLRIRRMAAKDLDAVIEIERLAESAPHWTSAEYLAVFHADAQSSFKRYAMVAEGRGDVVGFAVVRVVEDEAELESIVVASAWRGIGLGRLLLAESADQAKEAGATRLDLEVRESNAAALRLYLAAGLREVGRRRGYYRDPEEDAVLMSVNL